jgi:hypothetical protein
MVDGDEGCMIEKKSKVKGRFEMRITGLAQSPKEKGNTGN